MKLILALAVVVCVVAVSQAAPQGLLNTAFLRLSSTLYNLTAILGQVGTLLLGVGNAAGATVQSLVGGVLSAITTLPTLPSATLTAVNTLLSNTVNQIATTLAGVTNNLNTLVPALGNIQTILASTVNNLRALNVTGLAPLQNTLNQLSAGLSTAVGQIAG